MFPSLFQQRLSLFFLSSSAMCSLRNSFSSLLLAVSSGLLLRLPFCLVPKLCMGTSHFSYLIVWILPVCHYEGRSNALISALRMDEQGAGRDLWGGMSENTWDQPFPDRQTPLFEICDWCCSWSDCSDTTWQHHFCFYMKVVGLITEPSQVYNKIVGFNLFSGWQSS